MTKWRKESAFLKLASQLNVSYVVTTAFATNAARNWIRYVAKLHYQNQRVSNRVARQCNVIDVARKIYIRMLYQTYVHARRIKRRPNVLVSRRATLL